MKKLVMVMAAVVVAAGMAVAAADAVDPVSITCTNARTDSISYVNATEYYRGATIVWSNCVMLTTGAATQGLNLCAVEMKWGLSTTAQTFNASIGGGASSNVWNLSMTCPTNWEAPYVQLKVTDSNTNSYIYPWMMIHTKASL